MTTIDYSYHSLIYSGNDTKNVLESRNCIQLNPQFLYNPSSWNPNTEQDESYYIKEFVTVNDYTYFVFCSVDYYNYGNTIYKVTNGVRELYCDLTQLANLCNHSLMRIDSNQNLYFVSFNIQDGMQYYGIYKISKDKVRSLAINITDITDSDDIIDYIISNKSACIYILYRIYVESDGYHYYLDKYNLSDYSLIKHTLLDNKKPNTYDSAYGFEPKRLFLKADGTPYIYGQKTSK